MNRLNLPKFQPSEKSRGKWLNHELTIQWIRQTLKLVCLDLYVIITRMENVILWCAKYEFSKSLVVIYNNNLYEGSYYQKSNLPWSNPPNSGSCFFHSLATWHWRSLINTRHSTILFQFSFSFAFWYIYLTEYKFNLQFLFILKQFFIFYLICHRWVLYPVCM